MTTTYALEAMYVTTLGLDVDYIYLDVSDAPEFDDIPYWSSSNPTVARISSVTEDARICNVAIGTSGDATVVCVGKIKGRKTTYRSQLRVDGWSGDTGIGRLRMREVVLHEPEG